MIPGEYQLKEEDIELCVGRDSFVIEVANTGDRPIQVGSHYHFAETNNALSFERQKAYGHRLAIAAGTAVRFEPGQKRNVSLLPFGGLRHIYGFRGEVMGPLDKAADGDRNDSLETDLETSLETSADDRLDDTSLTGSKSASGDTQ